MSVFNIDGDDILGAIETSLADAGQSLSDEAFEKIARAIDSAIPGLVELVTFNTETAWKDLAKNSGGWGVKYAKAIRSQYASGTGRVYLDASSKDKGSNRPNLMFAKMMEEGVQTWSIKDALMKSDKAKIGKDGVKYIIVPFPVATPRKKGSGHKSSYFGGREMSGEIHKLVKAGLRAPEGSTVTVTTSHKTSEVSIEGLTRYNSRTRHSQYGIFRRVTAKSKGWQYPSVAATPIYPKVKQYVDKRIGEILEQYCRDLVKEFGR